MRQMKSWPLILAAVALAGMTVSAAANDIDPAYTGPIAGFDPCDKTFHDVKSPLLTEGQWFGTTWAVHSTLPLPNTAGVLFDLHYDGHEVSSLNVIPHAGLWMPGGAPCLPGSQSSTQTVRLSMWVPNAQSSGTWLPQSELLGMFCITGNAKNTFTCNNSDIDITLDIWRIRHIVFPFQYFEESAYFYLTGTTLSANWATVPGQGNWVHYTGGFTCNVPCSVFVATHCWIENVAGYGIEHMPEPASMVLMLFGVGVCLMGRRRR
jgi:hypothetical protein